MKKLILLLLLALPSFGAITVVQSVSCDNAGSPSISWPCSFSSPVTPGNAVVALMTTYNTTFTVTDSSSNTYILDGTGNVTPTTAIAYAYHAENVAASGTFTVTATVAASSFIIIHLYEVSGLATSGAADKTATVSLNTSQPSGSVGPTATTTTANEIAFAMFSSLSTTTPTAAGGYTLGSHTDNASVTDVTQADEYQILSATGAQTAPMTISAAWINGYGAVLVTFKAAGGGGGGNHTAMPIVAFSVSSPSGAACQGSAVNSAVFTFCSSADGQQSSATAASGPSVFAFGDITCLLYVNRTDAAIPLLGTVAPGTANWQCSAAGVFSSGTISLAPMVAGD